MPFAFMTDLLAHLRRRLVRQNQVETSAECLRFQSTTLPTELFPHIFTLVASDPELGQASLASITGLSTATRPWAEKRIYSNPIIGSSTQLGKLGKTLKKSKRLSALTDQVTLDGSTPGGDMKRNVTASLPTFFRAAPAVRALVIRNAAIDSLADFANAERLTHLTMINTTLADRTSTFSRLTSAPSFARLTSLTSLTFHDASFLPATAEIFFSRTITPSLRRLELNGNCSIEGPSPKRSLSDFESIKLLTGLEELVIGSATCKTKDQDVDVGGRRTATSRTSAGCTRLNRL